MTRLVLLATSPRVAPSLLSAAAWDAVRSGPVFVTEPGTPAVTAMRAAGASVRVVDADQPAAAIARTLLDAARASGTATWLVGPDGDVALSAALDSLTGPDPDDGPVVAIERVAGSWDLPGARLLDVVATMDRLRSPGGCPWDAEQDHETLAPYLLEEAYEAFQAIEDGSSSGLREELGDVLLQVAFHARLAQERPEGERWSIDDVASGLVDKLVRRHPHVFGDTVVGGAEEVNANWETIKAAERGGASALASVPLAAPALTLASTLQRKASRSEDAVPLAAPMALDDAVRQFGQSPSSESAGELLWAAVAAMRAVDVDPEAALRARAKSFRDVF